MATGKLRLTENYLHPVALLKLQSGTDNIKIMCCKKLRKKMNISNFQPQKWSWSLMRAGRLQEVPNIVI